MDFELYRSADVVFALSADEAERLEAGGVAPERVRILPLGPTALTTGDGHRWRTTHEVGDRFVMAYIGRRSRAKGLKVLLDAFSGMRARGHDCVLAIAGPEADVVVDDDASPGLVDLGVCSEQEKADLLAACDIFVLPSTAESFGLVYLDAWLYAKPVVGGSAPAVRGLIRHGVDGWIVEHSAVDLADRLAMAAADRPLLHAMGLAGQQRARDEHSWRRCVAVLTRGLARVS